LSLPFYIARKYFFSKRKKHFINVISIISVLVVAFSTAALIIVLSVFNGLEGLLRSLYSSFDPEIKIESVKGKSFEVTDQMLVNLNEINGVELVTEVIEDYVYLRYREADMVVRAKGVSDNFIDQHRIDGHIVNGDLKLKEEGINYAIIGRGIQYALSVAPGNDLYALQVYYIKNLRSGSLDPSRIYARELVVPAAVFSIEKNFDENYIFLPIEVMSRLMEYEQKRTSLEIKTKSAAVTPAVQNAVKQLLGNDFLVLNNDEQHKDLYKILKMEKLFVFLAFSLILAIGAINVFFTLSMLAIDKKKDISVLFALGASPKLISRIFLTEGALISLSGAAIGLVLGGLICWLQMEYALVSMGMELSIAEGYPVAMRLMDFVYTSLVIILITVLVSARPSWLAARYYNVQYL
jgi:lipoprotein-releasing system permease protein